MRQIVVFDAADLDAESNFWAALLGGSVVHLDLHVDDLGSAHDDPTAEEGFQVYADPAGHPFCLCWS
jgi:hypothetical protein